MTYTRTLLPSTRAVLHAFATGMRKRDIAAERGCTLGTIETHIRNGRAYLREHGYPDTGNWIKLGHQLAAYERDETARVMAEWRHMTAV